MTFPLLNESFDGLCSHIGARLIQLLSELIQFARGLSFTRTVNAAVMGSHLPWFTLITDEPHCIKVLDTSSKHPIRD
ncbi:hypothetical protein N185_32830 [Sinorhizobium sp. GW3]|nr:hypothetical protein N185_32830 [Sinorhizobium sp. GW3]